jgi:hypothetical protein
MPIDIFSNFRSWRVKTVDGFSGWAAQERLNRLARGVTSARPSGRIDLTLVEWVPHYGIGQGYLFLSF